ncbi:MAG: DUF819 family protein [Bacteroidales bacterium]|nr:DUF819 family protein [Bacteroidales bacterium]
MISFIVLFIIYFAIPALILQMLKRWPFLDKIGSVGIAYLFGIAIANSGFLPENASKVQEIINTISIPLAIPMLIFSFDVRSWLKLAKPTVISLFITIFSVVIVVFIGRFIFDHNDPEHWKIPGMLIGVYTGGTPNLASIQAALDVEQSRYILVHTSDMIFSTIYLLFLMFAAKPIFKYILPQFNLKFSQEEEQITQKKVEDKKIRAFLLPILLSVLIFAIGGSLSLMVPNEYQMVVVMLSITSLGVLFSLNKKVRSMSSSFDIGMYLILAFSVNVASMADFSQFSIDSLNLFLNIGFVIFGSVALQAIISSFFKIDTDTTIITSTALICSPPFVPVIAGALKNRAVIFSGLTVGIIGYVIGNYLGIGLALLWK